MKNTFPLIATVAIASASAAAALTPPFTGWSEPERLDSLPASSDQLSTPAVDGCVSWSRDGLSLYFTSNRTGDFDIYVATRPTRDTGFSYVKRLPAPVNQPGTWESCPTVGKGNRLYFTGTADDPAGDLYVTRKTPTGWTDPVNLGPNINTTGLEESPTFHEDASGREVMYYNVRPTNPGPGYTGESIIMMSVDGGPAVPAPGEINATFFNARPTLSRDGMTMWFDSTRSGFGGSDIFVATRSSLSQPFGNVTHVPELSSPAFDARPAPSFDGSAVAFSSNRAGSNGPAPDIWIAQRDRIRGKSQ